MAHAQIDSTTPPGKRLLRLCVNGAAYAVAARPSALLLDVLRDDLRLVGTKRGCDMGTCGCCNVLLDGRAVTSCLVLAFDCEDKKITTIEGITTEYEERVHPLQEAWAECGGSQCGFCTPGFVMTAHALLAERSHPSRVEIAQAISGNVCRCTGYKKIIDAVQLAAERLAAVHSPEQPI